MPEPGGRALEHLVRAAQELVLSLAAAARALAGSREVLDRVREALRVEEKRWAERAAHDPAAERVREIFAALSDVLEPSVHTQASRDDGGFDRPRRRWDTRK